jgi:hypothetical protein
MSDGSDPKGGDMGFSNPMADEECDDMKGEMVKELQQAAFGTRSEDIEEDEDATDRRIRDKWYGILHPDMASRGLYDLFQLFIMLYLGWLLPTRLAFTKTAAGPLEVALDLIIDFSVYCDMFLQTKMCSYDNKTKKLIHDQKRIKNEYLKSWFLVDFFSVVPADQILLLVGTLLVDNGSPEWGMVLLDYSVAARLMRLLRLVRLAKIQQLLNMKKIIHQLYQILHHLVRNFGPRGRAAATGRHRPLLRQLAAAPASLLQLSDTREFAGSFEAADLLLLPRVFLGCADHGERSLPRMHLAHAGAAQRAAADQP